MLLTEGSWKNPETGKILVTERGWRADQAWPAGENSKNGNETGELWKRGTHDHNGRW